jgi:anti-anti-sigma regulatory factor
MVLVGVNKRVLETLHETRVQQFFSIFPTVEEAEREVMAGKK